MPYLAWSDFLARVAAGQVVSFPTDTVPALATRPEAGAAIFAVKQRSPDKPLILMGAQWADLEPYVAGSAAQREQWQALADQYWPGALTLVLPASERVPAVLHPQDPRTIGLRVPALAIARDLLAATGPLATTSANRSGEPPLATLAAIAAAFPEVGVLAAPPLEATQALGSGLPSTVIKWTAAGWQVLRQGSVNFPTATG